MQVYLYEFTRDFTKFSVLHPTTDMQATKRKRQNEGKVDIESAEKFVSGKLRRARPRIDDVARSEWPSVFVTHLFFAGRPYAYRFGAQRAIRGRIRKGNLRIVLPIIRRGTSWRFSKAGSPLPRHT